MNPKMGLLGGGDSMASSGWGQPPTNGPSAASWGSSPGNNSSSGWNSSVVSSANHWGNNGHQTNGESHNESSSSHSAYQASKPSWAQAVCINRGPNQTQVPNYSGNSSCSTSSRSHLDNSSDAKYNPTSSADHDVVTKHHHESTSRLPTEVLVADNWGHAVINQDKSWDVPPSPHEQCNSESEWKSSTAAGTEIWESTVRQKVKGSSAQSSSVNSSTTSPSGHQSWNHTPTTHIGGTWGEEEDSSIVWTGVPQQVNGGSSHASSNSNGSQNGALTSWGNSSNNRSSVPDATDTNVNLSWKADPGHGHRDDQQARNHSQNKSWGAPSWGDSPSQFHDMVPAPAKLSAINISSSISTHSEPAERLGTVVWGGEKSLPPPKPTESIIRPVRDIPGTTGWEDENNHFVPMSDKRMAPPVLSAGSDTGRDDGTAVWGNPQRQQKVSRWKEEQELLALQQQQQSNAKSAVVSANGNSSVPSHSPGDTSSGMIRMTPNAPIASKPMNDSWIKSQQAPQQTVINRSPWNEAGGGLISNHANHRDVMSNSSSASSGWGQGDLSGDKPRSSASGWGDPAPDSYGWGSKPKNSNSWSDGQIDTSSWGGPKQKPLSKEMILASKQFRVLTETGYKKDDVENALRSSNMNVEEALAELRSWASRDSSYPLSDDGKVKVLSSNTPTSLLTNGPNPSLPSISSNRSLSFGNQQQQQLQSQSYPSVNQVSSALRSQPSRGSTQAPLPSEKQLFPLVQQIQLAVQSGHLNAQILNQPLAPPTIQLIYQLLQSIKHLQNLQGQVATQLQSKMGGVNGGWNSPMQSQSQLHVQITQAKQRISNLQNQIAVNQAMYIKQTQPNYSGSGSGNIPSSPVGHNPTSSVSSTLDFMKAGGVGPESSSSISSDFRDLSSLKQDPQSQSRLKTTWKLPSFDKDPDPLSSNEPFSRAPGSTVPKTSSGISVLPRPDPTWSNDTPAVGGWSDGSNQLANEVLKPEPNHMPSFVTELSVPEFEPGKPWKGTSQLKNFEDDPHVTPGSVNRSPLSVSASLFNNWSAATKVSPTEQPGINSDSSALSSLALSSSSTWAYNPASASLTNSFGSDKGNGNGVSGVPSSKTWSSFGENNDSLWSGAGTGVTGSGSATKPRGPPPPGLSGQQVPSDGSDPASVQNLMCLLNNLLVGSVPNENQQE